jgi:hypothetical protein
LARFAQESLSSQVEANCFMTRLASSGVQWSPTQSNSAGAASLISSRAALMGKHKNNGRILIKTVSLDRVVVFMRYVIQFLFNRS